MLSISCFFLTSPLVTLISLVKLNRSPKNNISIHREKKIKCCHQTIEKLDLFQCNCSFYLDGCECRTITQIFTLCAPLSGMRPLGVGSLFPGRHFS